MINEISSSIIPLLLLIILITGLYKRIKVYDVFVEGAKDGITTVSKILPSLLGLLVAVGVFRASGAVEILAYMLKPMLDLFSIPKEVLPLAILRPVSGSASLALVADLLKQFGPDSIIGRISSTMMGSTETIFYTLTVYFGAIGIKNIRYTLVAALLADIVSVLVSVLICRKLFLPI